MTATLTLFQGNIAISRDGTIFCSIYPAGGSGSGFKAFNPDGSVKWDSGIDPGYAGQMLLTPDEGLLYVMLPAPFTSPASGLSPVDGSVKWSTDLVSAYGYDYVAAAVGPDNTGYYLEGGEPRSSFGDTLVAVDERGTILWSHKIGHGGWAAFGGVTPSFPVVAEDNSAIYLTQVDWTANSWLVKLDPVNGNELLAINLNALYGESWAGLAGLTADGNVVVVGYSTSTFYCFKPDGTLKWSASPGFGNLSPAFARDNQGTLYVAVRMWPSSLIYKCDPSSGALTVFHDATPEVGLFTQVGGIAVDADGFVYFVGENGGNID
jgi:hypothetical protein